MTAAEGSCEQPNLHKIYEYKIANFSTDFANFLIVKDKNAEAFCII